MRSRTPARCSRGNRRKPSIFVEGAACASPSGPRSTVSGVIANCLAYRDGARLRDGQASVREAAMVRRDCDFVWLEVIDPPRDEVQALGEHFGLPELAVEDAYKAHQRPKVEQHGDTLFVALRTLRRTGAHDELDVGEMHMFAERSFVIVVRHGGDEADLDEIRARAEAKPELLRLGPGAVVHAVMDEVVDDYGPVLDGISNDIDEVEQQVFSEEETDTTQRIFRLMRQVLEVRRTTSPLIAPLERMHSNGVSLVAPGMQTYFRDVHDHVQRANDRVEAFRDLLAGILEANTALGSVRQNEGVRKISGWAAIIAVPTLITGIYGMNFQHMPELRWVAGYPLALALILAVSLTLYLVLRRVQWL